MAAAEESVLQGGGLAELERDTDKSQGLGSMPGPLDESAFGSLFDLDSLFCEPKIPLGFKSVRTGFLLIIIESILIDIEEQMPGWGILAWRGN